MGLHVREMRLDETGIVVDYFHRATPEHLELLGVDPTRLPPRSAWRQFYEADHALPPEQRRSVQVLWLDGGEPIGFSTADKIVHGLHAHMHLHVLDPDRRRSGVGVHCVRESVALYFERLRLQRLYCEPHAFNTAPNRTLQKAGFRYVKTYKTVPGPLNFHQAVTQWVMEAAA